MIYDILDKFENKIVRSRYPANEAFKILILEYDFDYDVERETFMDWCEDLGILVNMDNF